MEIDWDKCNFKFLYALWHNMCNFSSSSSPDWGRNQSENFTPVEWHKKSASEKFQENGMFGTTFYPVHKPSSPTRLPKAVQARVAAIKASWDAKERKHRKEIAERRIRQLVTLLGLNEQVDAA
jgi:hypothetical protein